MSETCSKGAQEELWQEGGGRREGQGGDAEEDQAGVRRKAEAEGDRGDEEGEGSRGENQVGKERYWISIHHDLLRKTKIKYL